LLWSLVNPSLGSVQALVRASMLESGRLYVNDRGDASFQLLRNVLEAGSSFITRVKDDIAANVRGRVRGVCVSILGGVLQCELAVQPRSGDRA
jgi:hypothetical protein